eukprot:388453-Amphidinium_carterae.1
MAKQEAIAADQCCCEMALVALIPCCALLFRSHGPRCAPPCPWRSWSPAEAGCVRGCPHLCSRSVSSQLFAAECLLVQLL